MLRADTLLAEISHGLGARTDEGQAGFGAGIDEFRAFAQKTVAGVNGVGTRELGDADIFVDLQIGLDRAETLADQIGFVGLEPVKRQLVLLGEDTDGLDAEFIGGAKHPNGDFTAIGDENFRDRHLVPVVV